MTTEVEHYMQQVRDLKRDNETLRAERDELWGWVGLTNAAASRDRSKDRALRVLRKHARELADALTALLDKKAHEPGRTFGTICAACGCDWPCPQAVARAALSNATKEET